jgi:hypothetical protein
VPANRHCEILQPVFAVRSLSEPAAHRKIDLGGPSRLPRAGVPAAPTARQHLDASMNGNTLRTWTLLAALGGLLIAVGGLLGGRGGMVLALAFAVLMNGVVYGARELKPGEAQRLRAIVASLAGRAGLPMPRPYIVDRPEPNAFATGRDPDHAAVAVTTGLLSNHGRASADGGARPRAVARKEPRHARRDDCGDDRRNDQLPRPDGAVPAHLRRSR